LEYDNFDVCRIFPIPFLDAESGLLTYLLIQSIGKLMSLLQIECEMVCMLTAIMKKTIHLSVLARWVSVCSQYVFLFIKKACATGPCSNGGINRFSVKTTETYRLVSMVTGIKSKKPDLKQLVLFKIYLVSFRLRLLLFIYLFKVRICQVCVMNSR
jgi:hypothetical protein